MGPAALVYGLRVDEFRTKMPMGGTMRCANHALVAAAPLSVA
jgi:hypothetical protein